MPKITKKEQQRRDEARHQERVRGALRWITEPRPTPMVYAEEKAKAGGDWRWLMIGWSCHVWSDNYRIEQGCCDGIYHACGDITKTTTQGRGLFYRTRREALIEARYRMQEKVAQQLARLDKEIEETPPC